MVTEYGFDPSVRQPWQLICSGRMGALFNSAHSFAVPFPQGLVVMERCKVCVACGTVQPAVSDQIIHGCILLNYLVIPFGCHSERMKRWGSAAQMQAALTGEAVLGQHPLQHLHVGGDVQRIPWNSWSSCFSKPSTTLSILFFDALHGGGDVLAIHLPDPSSWA